MPHMPKQLVYFLVGNEKNQALQTMATALPPVTSSLFVLAAIDTPAQVWGALFGRF